MHAFDYRAISAPCPIERVAGGSAVGASAANGSSPARRVERLRGRGARADVTAR